MKTKFNIGDKVKVTFYKFRRNEIVTGTVTKVFDNAYEVKHDNATFSPITYSDLYVEKA